MKKFNTKLFQGVWVSVPEQESIQIKLRPFSMFSTTKNPTDVNFELKEVWNQFNYCVTEWKGFQDEDGDMECNEVNKKIVFEYDQDLALFILKEANSLILKVFGEKEIKNSETSKHGDTIKDV